MCPRRPQRPLGAFIHFYSSSRLKGPTPLTGEFQDNKRNELNFFTGREFVNQGIQGFLPPSPMAMKSQVNQGVQSRTHNKAIVFRAGTILPHYNKCHLYIKTGSEQSSGSSSDFWYPWPDLQTCQKSKIPYRKTKVFRSHI